MKISLKNFFKNSIFKTLIVFVFVLMCSSIMLPVNAFATSESITGKLTLELASSGGGGDIVPSGGSSAPIDASTTSSTGAFNFLPIILCILVFSLLVLLIYLYKTGKLKNKTLSIFALCLVVSVGVCGTKTIIANAANGGASDNQGISSSAYLKFDEAGKVLENKLDITNSTDSTINIENITCDSGYASIFPDLAGIRITGNSSYESKLNCDVVPASLIEKARESQGKAEIEGFFSVNFNKEQPIPTGEPYAYKDTSNNKGTTLVFAYDNEKSTHDVVYEIPDHPTQASSWAWDGDRDVFTQVKVNEDFKYYSGLTSTSYMFYNFKNVSDIEGFENLNTSNVTNMACMFQSFGYMSTTINSVPNVSDWNTSQVTDVNSMFYNYGYSSKVLNSVPDVSKWDTSNITSIYAMFYRYGYSSLSLNSAPDMSQWHTSKITDMSSMFFDYGYKSNLLQASPNMSNIDTSNVTNMSYMFYDYGYTSKVLNAVPDVSNWDTSKVTDMSFMFYNYAQTSTSIEVVPEVKNWDTSNVENMSSMFYGFGGSSSKLNAVPDVSSWITTKLTYVTYMFNNYGNKSPILNEAPKVEDWDTSNVTSMSFLFAGYGEKSSAISNTPNVSKWNTEQVTDMSYMFCNYASGVQIESLDISGFDTKSVTNCNRMLSGAKLKSITLGVNFNLDLSSSEGHLTSSSGEKDATWYDNGGIAYEKCCMGKGVRDEATTYYDTNPAPIPAEVYAYKDTSTEDQTALVFAYDIDKSSHIEKGQTIYDISTTATQASSWAWDGDRDVFTQVKVNEDFKYYSGLTSTSYMFYNFKNVSTIEGFENLNTSNVTNMACMFQSFGYMSTIINSVPNVSDWNTSQVTDVNSMFYNYGYSSKVLSSVPDVSTWDTTNITSIYAMFYRYGYSSLSLNSAPDMSQWTTSKITDMSSMFFDYGYKSNLLQASPNMSNIDTSNVTNMSYMFYDYGYTSKVLNAVPDASSWKTSKVTDMSFMFYNYAQTSTSIEVAPEVKNWDTSNVENMSSMFYGFGGSSATLNAVPDVSSWITTKLTYITYMFYNYGNKSTVLNKASKVEDWDTSNVTSMSFLFAGYGEKSSAINAVPNVSKWNTTQVTDMSYMFYNYASSVQIESLDISGFDTKSVTNCNRMLSGIKLKSITLGVNFNLDLTTSEGHLTNSSGDKDATWYDKLGKAYEKCAIPETRDKTTTYYDHDPREAYGYKDTTDSGATTLVLTYDDEKSTHENTYDIPESITKDSDWKWYDDREAFTKVEIKENFKNYSGLTSTAYMFNGFKNVSHHSGFEYLNTSNVTDMSQMFFEYAGQIVDFNFVPDVENWDTSKVTNMYGLFAGYANSSTKLNLVPNVSKWDTQSITNIVGMFMSYGDQMSFECLDLSSFDTTKITKLTQYVWALAGMKLKSIKISSSFKLPLDSVTLTNSEGSIATSTSWYDEDCKEYSLGQLPVGESIKGVTTYYDHDLREAYGYMDGTTLVITFDKDKSTHKDTEIYDIPESASKASDWKWDKDRDTFKKIDIKANFKDYSGLTSTSFMFSDFNNLNESAGLENINTSNVTNMSSMFKNWAYNSTTLNAVPDVSKWDTSKVTDMSGMFYNYGYSSIKLDTVPNVSEWNISNLANLSEMFSFYGYNSTLLNAVPDVSSWATSSVTSMSAMFESYGQSSSELSKAPSVSEWDTSKVENMSSLFYDYAASSTKLNEVPDVSKWTTSNVTNMSNMFFEYGKLQVFDCLYLNDFDTNKTESYSSMLSSMKLKSIKLGKDFKLSLTSTGACLTNSSGDAGATWYDEDGGEYKECAIPARDKTITYYDYDPTKSVAYAYKETTNDETSLILTYDKQKTTHKTYYDITASASQAGDWAWNDYRHDFTSVKINASFNAYKDLTSTSFMFYDFINVKDLEGFGNLDTSKVTNMSSMFYKFGSSSTNLNKVPDVEDWDTSKVTNMSDMFKSYGESSNSIDCLPNLLKWKTSNVEDMSGMFEDYGKQCAFEVLDLSNFDTNKTTTYTSMLSGLKLESIKLGTSFNLSLTSSNACLTNRSGEGDATWYDKNLTKYESCSIPTTRDETTTYYDEEPREAYGYKDTTSENGQTILILTYDNNRSQHDITYDIPTEVKYSSSWGWDKERDSFTKVKIDENFKNYNKLTSTVRMFEEFNNTSEFLGFENLDTSKVTDMTHMFYIDESPTSVKTVPNVSNWDTSKVTNMNAVFSGYGRSSTELDAVPDVSNWDTSNVTNMQNMFEGYGIASTALNSVPDVSKWNTFNVINAYGMFNYYGRTSEVLDKVPDISNWDTSNLAYTNYMFHWYGKETTFDCLDLSNWNTSNIKQCKYMLEDFKLYSIKLGPNFNLKLSNIGAYLENRSGTYNATWYDSLGNSYPICGMGTSARTEVVIYYDTAPEPYGYIETSNSGETLVVTYDSARSFHDTTYSIPKSATKAESWGWYGDRNSFAKVKINESFKNYKLTSTAYMFYNFENVVESQDFSNIDTSEVTDMQCMFNQYGYNVNNLNTVPDVSKWNTTNVKNMSHMFDTYGYSSYSLNKVPDVSNWNTSNVTNMSYMFEYYNERCRTLNNVPDVSKWNTSNVTTIKMMFASYGGGSTVLNAVPDVSNWNTSCVTDMSAVFYLYGSASTKLSVVPNVSKWNTSNVTEITTMFAWYGSSSSFDNLDLSGWDTSKVITKGLGYYIKLKSITISPNFTINLKSLNLTNRYGVQDATWYDKQGNSYAVGDLPVGSALSGVVTYYDSPCEAYGYKDTSTENDTTTLVLAYDHDKNLHSDTYDMPTSATQASDWKWYDDRESFTKIKISESFKNYSDLTSTAYMFSEFKNAQSLEGLENINTSNVTDMSQMFCFFGGESTFSNLDLSNFDTSKVVSCGDMLCNMKLETITLGTKFNLSLDNSNAALTNVKGVTNATWYDINGKSYAQCGMGKTTRTAPTTYYCNDTNEPYAYKDTSESGQTTLVLTNDVDKTKHKQAGEEVYELNTKATQASDWEWDQERELFTKVTIKSNFKSYSGLTSTAYMFDGFKNISSHSGFENIDTSNVTNLFEMFHEYGSQINNFNIVPNVSNWDTSKVTNMFGMFWNYGSNSTSLNQIPSVSRWNTSQVTDMSSMFCNYGSKCEFDMLDLSNFDTKQVSSYSSMLFGFKIESIKLGTNFNLSLTSSNACLTNSFSMMDATWYDENSTKYESCSIPTTRDKTITYYDYNANYAYGYKETTEDGDVTLVVTYDEDRASHDTTYNIPRSATAASSWGWNNDRGSFTKVRIDESFKKFKLTSTRYMFCNISKVKESEGFTNLNTSKVTDMCGMFYSYGSGVDSLNTVPDVSNWDTSKVTDMSIMFWRYGAISTKLDKIPDVSKWDTSKVTTLMGMFTWYGTKCSFDCLDLSSWDTNKVTDVTNCFNSIKLKSITISPKFTINLKTAYLTDRSGSLNATWYNKQGDSYAVSDLPVGSALSGVATYYDFPCEAYAYKETSTENDVTSLVIAYDRDRTLHSDTYDIPTSATCATDWKWSDDIKLFTKVKINDNFKNYDKLTSTSYMFSEFKNVSDHDGFENINTTNVTNMSDMFSGYGNEQLNKVPNMTSWDTSKVTNMSQMFYSYGFESTFSNLDLSSFSTIGVTHCSKMLCDMRLKSITLGNKFNLDLKSTYAYLTNSNGEYNAKWYDSNGVLYGKCGMGKSPRTQTVIYYDHDPREAYGYKDKSEDGQTTLVLANDAQRTMHEQAGEKVYELNTKATQESDWDWDQDRELFTKVIIKDNFKDYSGFTSTAYMFSNFTKVNSHEGFEYLDTSNVTNMCGMFCEYGSQINTFNTVPNVKNWDTSNVANISDMFKKYGCNSTLLKTAPDVSSWNTSNIENMSSLFESYSQSSSALNEVPDVSKWRTSKVTNMSKMFFEYGKAQVFDCLYLNNFDTNNIESYSSMLSGMKLKSIKLGANFKLSLTSLNACLTNSEGNANASWYDEDGIEHEGCVIPERDKITTYYDHDFKGAVAYAYKETTTDKSYLILTYDNQKSSHEAVYEIPVNATQASDWKWNDCRDNFTNIKINASFSAYHDLTSTSFMFFGFTCVSSLEGFCNLNTSKVTNMSSMFFIFGSILTNLNNVPDVEDWDTTNVTNMSNMFKFYGAYSQSLNQLPNVSKWNTSNVENMAGMFCDYGKQCTFDMLDLSSFDTSKTTSYTSMLSGFKIESIKLGTSFNLPLSSTNACLTNRNGESDATWYDENSTKYKSCSIPTTRDKVTTYYDHDLKAEAYAYKDTTSENGETILVLTYDIAKSTYPKQYVYDIPEFATSESDWEWDDQRDSFTKVKVDESFKYYHGLTSTAWMFGQFHNTCELEGFEYLDTSNVENMSYMFLNFGSYSSTLSTVPSVTNWDISNVENTSYMFMNFGSSSTKLNEVPDVTKWNTSKVEDMSNMFKGYGYSVVSLNNVPDVSKWNTSKAKDMSYMFANYGYSASTLNKLPNMSGWDTSNVTNMAYMFVDYCHSSSQAFSCLDLSSFNTSNVTIYKDMLKDIKLKSIKLGVNFNLELDSNDNHACLTNSSRTYNANWYSENGFVCESCKIPSRTEVLTYYDYDGREAYAYKDTTTWSGQTALIFTYDFKKSTHQNIYLLSSTGEYEESWAWNSERYSFTKVKINENFKGFTGLHGTNYMFYNFANVQSCEGFEYINTSNVTTMKYMFSTFGYWSTTFDSVVDVSSWDVSNVTDMQYMFYCYGYMSTELSNCPDFSKWSTRYIAFDSMLENYGYSTTKLTNTPCVDGFHAWHFGRMFKNYGHNCVFDILHLEKFSFSSWDDYDDFLDGLRLKSIVLNWSNSRLMGDGNLTNSKGEKEATWYDLYGCVYSKPSRIGWDELVTKVRTVYDHKVVSTQDNDTLTPGTNQDKSSSIDEGVKEKITENKGSTAVKTDTPNTDVKYVETTSISSYLLNFTNSIMSLFNRFKFAFY